MASRTLGRVMVLLGVVSVGSLQAQGTAVAPRQLSLGQALDLARQNNPAYQQSLRTTIGAGDQLRAAQAAFLPSVSSSLSFGYSGGGSTPVAGTVFQESSRMSSSYSIGVSLGLSVDKWYGPQEARANQKLVDENIGSAKSSINSQVSLQYLTALRASAVVEVAKQQLVRDTAFLSLARVRHDVGLGDSLDVEQAQLDVSRAQVALLRVLQTETDSKIELLHRIGLTPGSDVDSLRLTETFPLVELKLDVATLQHTAQDASPGLRVANAQENASLLSLKVARKAEWWPSFSIGTSLSGSSQASTNTNALLANSFASAQSRVTSCQFNNALYSRLTSPLPIANGGIVADCNLSSGLTADGTALAPEVAAAVRDANGGFPFDYQRAPLGLSLGFSYPIWDNYSRANRISAARVAEEDSRDRVRSSQLDLDASIMQAVSNLKTLWASIQIDDQVRQNARSQLALAQAKYNAGSATRLDVQTAENSVTSADADYVAAVYDYHSAVVSLRLSSVAPFADRRGRTG